MRAAPLVQLARRRLISCLQACRLFPDERRREYSVARYSKTNSRLDKPWLRRFPPAVSRHSPRSFLCGSPLGRHFLALDHVGQRPRREKTRCLIPSRRISYNEDHGDIETARTSPSKVSNWESVFSSRLCWYFRCRRAVIARSLLPADRCALAISCSLSNTTWI